MLGFAIGLVSANAAEWFVHKYVLHEMGRKKGSFWSFHWHEHHRHVRKSGGYDPMYEKPILKTPSKLKELLGVSVGPILSTPLLAISPGFVAAGWLSAAAYYHVHKKSHLDPAWGRKWVPWHVDHHMGPNQDKNWCVTWPLFDWIMGTREPYVGTEKEAAAATRSEVASTVVSA
ncbi:MAG: sterol desaturase family protein [Myxococcales bacterium]|nr:sterol desaturase family protein [Myxococcales bacterium]